MASPDRADDSIHNHQPLLAAGGPQQPVHKIPRRPVPRRTTVDSTTHGIEQYQQVPREVRDHIDVDEVRRVVERDGAAAATNWEPSKRRTETMPTLAEKKTFYTVTTGLDEDTDDTNVNVAAKRDLTWRPQWLRPVVLAAFTGLFLCITVALPVALWYSQRHDGLARTRQSYGYVWRFGPTAGKAIPSFRLPFAFRHLFPFLFTLLSLPFSFLFTLLSPSLLHLKGQASNVDRNG